VLARDRATSETHVLRWCSWVEHLTRPRVEPRDLSTSFGNGTDRKTTLGACTLLGPEGPVASLRRRTNLRTYFASGQQARRE
jgi:hypothetical protein